MHDIHIDTAHGIDDLHKPVESNPGVVIDRNAKILVDCEATERNSSQSKRLVQLMHATAGYIDIEITRNREHPNTLSCGVNRYHNIGLSNIVAIKFLVRITT